MIWCSLDIRTAREANVFRWWQPARACPRWFWPTKICKGTTTFDTSFQFCSRTRRGRCPAWPACSRRAGYNIETLTVAPTEDVSLSRLTIVTSGSDEIIEQITNN